MLVNVTYLYQNARYKKHNLFELYIEISPMLNAR